MNHRADSDTTPTRRDDRLVWFLIAIGVALRLWQFGGGASLFIDEVALARNVAERGYAELLTPLDYGQVAPPGFLLAERLMWSVFGTDWSLRVIPLVGSIAALFLVWGLARRTIEGIAIPLVVGLCAVGVPFIAYGAQVKQYSTDMAIATGLLLLVANAIDNTSERRRRLALTGAAGVAAVWFSSTAILVVVGAGAGLCLLAATGLLADRRRVLTAVVLPWAVAAVAAAWTTARAVAPETLTYMQEFWRDGFLPLPPGSMHDLTWPWLALSSVFDARGLGYRLAPVFVGLALVGFVALWRARPNMTVVLLGPVLVTLTAAAAHRYPFSGRLVLFLNPVLLIAMTTAARTVSVWLESCVRYAGVVPPLCVALAAMEPIGREHPVYRIQETRTLLELLATRRQPGDLVFVWYRTVPNVAWYGPRYGLNASDTVTGGCRLGEPRRFLEDTDPLRGHARVWFVMPGGGPDVKLLSDYANQIGVREELLRVAPTVRGYFPMEVWRYDFSDSTRLARTSAGGFPVTVPPVSRAAVMACTAGPVATRR